MNAIERIVARSVPNGDCWEWTGGGTPDGYGQISISSRKHYTHRLSYELLVAPIPEGLTIDHLCRNKRCWNPDHLEPVTRAENVRRAQVFVKPTGRPRQGECSKGHPLSGDNLYVQKSGKQPGRRRCRTCTLAYQKEGSRMTTDPAVTTWTETFDNREDTDGLFHIPVDEEQERRVDAGLSWMTLCGEIRPPARETRDALIVAPDDCVVCAEIEIAGLDTP